MTDDPQENHPIPDSIVTRAANHDNIQDETKFHTVLAAVDAMDWMKVDLDAKARLEDEYERLGQANGATYYRVGRDWLEEVLEALAREANGGYRLRPRAARALSQCHDRAVLDENSVHIENGEGFVMSNREL